MLLTVNVDKKPMLPMIATAIDLLFNKPKDMFWTGRVMDLLFDGIPIECTSEDFTAKAVCGVFESGDVKAVQPLNDTHFSFSLFQSVSSEEIFDRSIPKIICVLLFFNQRRMQPIWVSSPFFVAKRIRWILAELLHSTTNRKW